MGSGKLDELSIMALHRGVTMIVFDQELNPSQIRSIADRVEIKVIDPDPADPGYFCPTRQESGRQTPRWNWPS